MITLCPMKVFSKLEGTKKKELRCSRLRRSQRQSPGNMKFGLDASSYPQPPNLFTEPRAPDISLETVGTTMAQT